MIRFLPERPAARSEEDLYAGLLRADGDVFDELYREAFPRVRRALLKRSCPPAEAGDLFQDALVTLWQNARDGRFELRAGARISGYLLQLCVNRWIDRTRRVAFRQTDTREAIPERGSKAATEAEAAEAERRDLLEARHARLDAAFEELGEACRQMLRRFYFERDSLADIAGDRGISAASAKTEKYRCMQRLRRLCEDLNETNRP